ncbi:MAG: hypothetical protein EPN86_01650 [Nanoarchaeota archaeon]|nr:MAG: hypothetical protein EPN86_01650 [Nanoarchaeota archaeon]
MALKKPNSMDECIYFTSRSIGDKGYAIAWVFKASCPKCKKAIMGKPKDEKTGKVQVRAKEYVCPACGNRIEKLAYEESLTCNIEYTCPECGKDGETQVPFKRKKVEGVDAVKFECGSCKARILVTKKMKDIKKKGKEDIDDDE